MSDDRFEETVEQEVGKFVYCYDQLKSQIGLQNYRTEQLSGETIRSLLETARYIQRRAEKDTDLADLSSKWNLKDLI